MLYGPLIGRFEFELLLGFTQYHTLDFEWSTQHSLFYTERYYIWVMKALYKPLTNHKTWKARSVTVCIVFRDMLITIIKNTQIKMLLIQHHTLRGKHYLPTFAYMSSKMPVITQCHCYLTKHIECIHKLLKSTKCHSFINLKKLKLLANCCCTKGIKSCDMLLKENNPLEGGKSESALCQAASHQLVADYFPETACPQLFYPDSTPVPSARQITA